MNALRYTPSGGSVTVTISVLTYDSDLRDSFLKRRSHSILFGNRISEEDAAPLSSSGIFGGGGLSFHNYSHHPLQYLSTRRNSSLEESAARGSTGSIAAMLPSKDKYDKVRKIDDEAEQNLNPTDGTNLPNHNYDPRLSTHNTGASAGGNTSSDNVFRGSVRSSTTTATGTGTGTGGGKTMNTMSTSHLSIGTGTGSVSGVRKVLRIEIVDTGHGINQASVCLLTA